MFQKLRSKFNFYNFFVYVFIVFIIFCLIMVFSNFNFSKGTEFFTTMIMALVSAITLTVSMKQNDKTNKNTNKLLEQNEKTRFIQLRYSHTKKARDDLLWILSSAMQIYGQLKNFHKTDTVFSPGVIEPRDFLIMIFILIISDKDLLNNLPVSSASEFQHKFEGKVSYSRAYKHYLSSKMDTYYKFSIKALSNHDDYKKFIRNFIDIMDDNVANIFVSYQNSSISLEEFENHFNETINKFLNNKIEELIIEDMNNELKQMGLQKVF